MAFKSSLVRYPDRGPWGSASYPGNATGYLVKDFIETYHPASLIDPMEGSGTSREVCRDLGITYAGYDLNYGDDIMAPATRQTISRGAAEIGGYDAVFWHPPYFDIIRYDLVRQHDEEARAERESASPSGNYGSADGPVTVKRPGGISKPVVADPRDFSTGGYPAYLTRMQSALMFLRTLLSDNENARIAVLIGDARHSGRYYWIARDIFEAGRLSRARVTLESLITREQVAVSSSAKHYDKEPIRIMHEFLALLEPIRARDA